MSTKGDRTSRLVIGLGAGGLAVGGAMLLGAPAAFAAGNGYAPSPAPGGTATGLPGSVVSVSTVPSSGGGGNATVGSSGVAVSVPAGTFSVPTQLAVTNATGSAITPPNGATSAAVFGVGFYQNGAKVTGTFSPVTVTVSSPSITAGSTVYLVVGSKLVAVQGAQVKNGSATFTISSDPTVEIAASAAPSPTAIPGATTVHTGKPFLLEGGVAGLLVVGGSCSLLLARRQRRRSA